MAQLDTLPAQTRIIDFEREHEETEGLKQDLRLRLGEVGLAGSQLMQTSLDLALDLHREDRRTYEPYANHLLRVALRLIEFGVEDENTIAAALLHDSLEDHPDELINMVPEKESPQNERDLRSLGYKALCYLTSEEVATIVRELSNPIVVNDQDKTAAYVDHIRNLTQQASLEALEIKICDFIDNTDAHGQEDPAKRESLDYKQKDVYALILGALPRLEGRPSANSRRIMQKTLTNAQKGALGRLDTYEKEEERAATDDSQLSRR